MTFNYHPVNEPVRYAWRGVSFADVANDPGRFEKALEVYNRVREEGYVASEHNWVFTYTSFLDFIRDGLRSKLLPYTLYYSDNVEPGANEFTIILKKDAAILTDDARRADEALRLVRLAEDAW